MLRLSVLFVPRLVCDIIHCEHHGSTLCSARPGQGKLDKMEHVLMNGQLSTFGGFQEIGSIGSIKFLAASRERRAAQPSQQSPCSNRRSQSRLAQVAVGSNFQHFCHDQRFVMIYHYYHPSNAMQFTSCLDLRGNIATMQ